MPTLTMEKRLTRTDIISASKVDRILTAKATRNPYNCDNTSKYR